MLRWYRLFRFYSQLGTCWALLACGCISNSALLADQPTKPKQQTYLANHVFAILGDYGDSGPNEASVAALIQWMEPTYIVTLGDNSYPNANPALLDDNIGQYYHSYIQFHPSWQGRFVGANNAIKEQRFFPAAGNHDWYQGTLNAFLGYFALPNGEAMYRHRHGVIEFFTLSTDPAELHGIDQKSSQAQWLKHSLASSDAPWKVVVMHHSPFATAEHGSHPKLQWPYKQWGADLVLSGHDHVYEHIVVDGMHYVVCGTGGAELDGFATPTLTQATTHLRYNNTFGAMKGHVFADQLALQYYNVDRVLIDEFVLKR